MLILQADVSGTIVKWLVENGAQITPGQVSSSAVHSAYKMCLSLILACMAYFTPCIECLLSRLRWLSCQTLKMVLS